MAVELKKQVAVRWRDYAMQRWRGKAERSAWQKFVLSTTHVFDGLQRGQSLDFELAHLQLALLRRLEGVCPYCLRAFGLATWAAVWDVPPERDGRGGAAGFRRLGNLCICCAPCAAAKGRLSGLEWIGVLEALRQADRGAAAAAVVALATGWAICERLDRRSKETGPS
jgi:hypothetical protein